MDMTGATGTARGRGRVVYVSYDGANEPLGRSQVVAYLERLARSWDITLVSFEKDDEEERRQTAAIAELTEEVRLLRAEVMELRSGRAVPEQRR